MQNRAHRLHKCVGIHANAYITRYSSLSSSITILIFRHSLTISFPAKTHFLHRSFSS